MRQAVIAAGRSDDAEVASPPEPEPAASAPRPPTLRGRLFGRLADYARRYLTASVEHRLTFALTELLATRAELTEARQQLDRLGGGIEAMAATLARLEGELGRRHEVVAERLGALPALLGPRLDELEIKVRPMIDFDAESYAVRLRDGYVFVPRDQPVFAVMVANATSGGLEPGTRRVLQALLQPGMGAADVGANVGLLTMASAMSVGPSGKVYAFEPEAGPRRQLEKTLHLHGLSWVELFDCALGGASETRTFHISPIIGHSSLYALPDEEERQARTVDVQVRRLDDVVAPGQRLDVVKIDVEGAELDVLAGMPRLLAENKDLAIVAEFGPSHLARLGVDPKAWFAAFRVQGFTPFAIGEPDGICRPTSPERLAGALSTNVAFVRPRGAAINRLPR
jgi:FkbM family methyltransferase